MGVDIRTRIESDLPTQGGTAMLTETQTGERTHEAPPMTERRPGLMTMLTATDSDIGHSELPSTVEAEPCAMDWSSVLPRRVSSRARRAASLAAAKA